MINSSFQVGRTRVILGNITPSVGWSGRFLRDQEMVASRLNINIMITQTVEINCTAERYKDNSSKLDVTIVVNCLAVSNH